MKLYAPIWALLDDDAQEHCTYSWLLPCAKCPDCDGSNNFLGVLHYPNMDLSGQAMFKKCAGEKMNGEYVPWDEFLKLRAALASQMEKSMPISGHTAFGPMTGKIRSAKTHILHPYPWAMLLPEPTLQTLQKAGVNLTAVQSSIKAPPQISPVYDVYAPPVARMSGRCADKRPYCKTCCVTVTGPGDLIIDQTSIPKKIDAFRCVEAPSQLLLTERFMNAVKQHSLTGLLVSEVSVN